MISVVEIHHSRFIRFFEGMALKKLLSPGGVNVLLLLGFAVTSGCLVQFLFLNKCISTAGDESRIKHGS